MSLAHARYSDPFQGKDDQWYFHLEGKNGEVQLTSEGYTSKHDAARGIIDAKRSAREADGVPVSLEIVISDESGERHFVEVAPAD